MKKTFEIYITAQMSECSKGGIRYEAWDMDMSNHSGRALVTSVPLEVEIPDDDLRPKFVDAMRKEQNDIRAELTAKVNMLEERIQSLLAIEGPK